MRIRQTVQQIGLTRTFFWFFAINLPLLIVLFLLPLSIPAALRGALALVGFAVTGMLFVLKLQALADRTKTAQPPDAPPPRSR